MRGLVMHLSEIRNKCDGLFDKTTKHLSHLSELIDDPFKYDSHEFRSEHEILEDKIASFYKRFRKIKSEVFTVSEDVIEKEVMRLKA